MHNHIKIQQTAYLVTQAQDNRKKKKKRLRVQSWFNFNLSQKCCCILG